MAIRTSFVLREELNVTASTVSTNAKVMYEELELNKAGNNVQNGVLLQGTTTTIM